MPIQVQSTPPRKVRFTADEYGRMLDAGLLENGRCELIEGKIVKMSAQRDPHMWAISMGSGLLHSLFPRDRFSVIVQGTLWLDLRNVPDPDLQVFDVPIGAPLGGLAPFLLIEVSHTTYRKDSGVKLRRYAANGIADYWIVNLQAKRIEVYRKPVNPTGKRSDWRYDDVRHFTVGQSIHPLSHPGVKIAVAEMLP